MQILSKRILFLIGALVFLMPGLLWSDTNQLSYLYEQMGLSPEISYRAAMLMTTKPEVQPGMTAKMTFLLNGKKDFQLLMQK